MDPRCRSHDPKVFCVGQIGRTSEPLGARAVLRVQGPAPRAPGIPWVRPITMRPARGLSESQSGSEDSDVSAQGLACGALTRIGPMSDPSHPWSDGHLGPLPSAPVQRPRLPSGSSAFARAAGISLPSRHFGTRSSRPGPGPVGSAEPRIRAALLIEP